MKAEDVLPDAINSAPFHGIDVRKGTIRAFLVNAEILERGDKNDPEYARAEADLKVQVPLLRALGVFDYFELRPCKAREMIDRECPKDSLSPAGVLKVDPNE